MRAFLTSAAKKLRRVSLMALSAVVIASLIMLPASAAGNGVMYFEQTTGTLKKDDTLNVKVRIDSKEEQVNAVQAVFTYPDDLLDFERIESAGTAFGIDAQSFGQNGKVNIARGNIIPVKGDSFVATVQFKVTASSGKADLTFTDESSIVRVSDNTDILGEKRGASFTIVTPGTNPPPSPSPTPSPSPSPTPTPSPTPASPAPVTPPPSEEVLDTKSPDEDLPSTGPTEFAGVAAGASALYYGVSQYLRSRKTFKSSIAEKLFSKK